MASTGTEERQGRDVTINLRVNRRQRALIDRAAEALGKNRSDFMLEVACSEAAAVLVDRRFFLLDEDDHRGGCREGSEPGVRRGGLTVEHPTRATLGATSRDLDRHEGGR